jgi:hypothetical protein
MLIVALLVSFVSVPAMADYLSNSWDIGNIRGGYSTSTYTVSDGNGTTKNYTQLTADIGSQCKITSCSASLSPNWQYVFDDDGNIVSRTQDGYWVNEYFHGMISTPLSLSDVGYQSMYVSFDARGINFSESVYLNCYNKAEPGDVPDLYANAGAYINISNFDVRQATGRYQEYDDVGPGYEITRFYYNVQWLGDFAPGSAPSGFVVPATGTSVPEPGTFALAGIGLISCVGGAFLRKRRVARN